MKKKKQAKKIKTVHKYLVRYITITFSVVVLFLLGTVPLAKYADSLFVNDQVSNAESLYKLAQLNPFLPGMDKRLLATQIVIKERTEENEETGMEKTIAFPEY